MRRAPLAIVLLAASSVFLASCRSEPTQPRYEVLPDMVDAVPGESFSSSRATRDGKTMMAPPPGVLAVNGHRFRYGPGKDEAARAGREVQSPVPASPETVKRGELVFQRFCSPCHGRGGLGDGPVIPRFPSPPSLLDPHARTLADGQIFHIITRGQGLMASHSAQVPPRDRWMAVHFIRSLQGVAK